MANLIPQIAQMLGVEVGEEFKIKDKHGEFVSDKTYKFSENALMYFHQEDDNIYRIVSRTTLCSLLNGNYEIVKLPWKPKVGEEYYTFIAKSADNPCLHVCCEKWNERLDDEALFKAGWIYRTKEEAKAALPKVAAEMGGSMKFKRENCNMLQKSLVTVAKNATAQSTLKKLRR